MTNLEKMKMFFEDVYGASCFWNDDECKSHLKIFVDDIYECDWSSLIDKAISRPQNPPTTDLICVTSNGPFEISENCYDGRHELVIHRRNDAGFIPYSFEPYLAYFLDEKLNQFPNGNEVKAKIDRYFKVRGVK
jgi:hypothetical protein